MKFLKRLFANEALSFILIMFIFGMMAACIGADTRTLLQTIVLCAILWVGVGLAIIREAIVIKGYGYWNPLSFTLKVAARAVLLGPFAHRIFR